MSKTIETRVPVDVDVEATGAAPPPGPAPEPRGEPAPPGNEQEQAQRAPALHGLVRLASGVGWAMVGLGVFVALWQLASWRAPDLPTPSETFERLRTLLGDPFYDKGPNDKGVGRHALLSLQKVGTGFLAAALVGIPMGIAMGASTRAWRAVNPIVQVLRPVSPLAWFPIALAASGDSWRAGIMVIFITALWPTVVSTAAAAAAVPPEQLDVARVFRFGRVARLRHILVPNALPGIMTGLRLSMGIAWMVIVAVEMLSSNGAGLGFFVWDSYNTGNVVNVSATIGVIGLIGMALDACFLRLTRQFAQEIRP